VTNSLPPWERPQWQQPGPGGTPGAVDPATGQYPYGQPAHGQQSYGQPTYGDPSYGQYPYGQPTYGNPSYGPPPWAQPQYGAPQYGTYPYGAPAGPPRRTLRKVLGWSIAGVLVLVALVVGAVLADDAATPDARVSAPAATWLPTGLGDEPALDRLAEQCHQGDMSACDDLFYDSDFDSEYEEYGDTCAGRRSGGAWAMCADVFTDAD